MATTAKPETTLYMDRMRRVLRYAAAHLDHDLRVEALSRVAAFSKYHFHRQFSALFGISAHDYVQLTRFKRASYRLAFRDGAPIIQIALECGYEAPESFARAFKQLTGQTPSAFRERPDWLPWAAAFAPLERIRSLHMSDLYGASQVRIVDFPETRVALLSHHGDPALIGETIRRFIAWRKQAGLPSKTSATFNILHVDPWDCAPQDFRLDLCAAAERSIMPNDDGVVDGVIPAGRCAVLRLTGSSDDLRAAVSYLYADWLPCSGEEPRDFPAYVQRVTFFPDVAENEAITDIFLPLRDRERRTKG